MFSKPKNWLTNLDGGKSKSKSVHSLENLKHLYGILLKNQTVTEQNCSLLVETLRSISEILIWGDQNDSTVFDFFLEKNMLVFFLKFIKQRSGQSICVQLLQTLNILFENISNETSVYYLLSNNHVNSIIVHKFDFSDEEVMAYFISFLKTLSIKLNKHTVHFFYNEHTNDFALYTEAIKFFDHSEGMVRIAVRTITLNVYKACLLLAKSEGEQGKDNKDMLGYLGEKTGSSYFVHLVSFIACQINDLRHCITKDSDHHSREKIEYLIAEHLDHLHYLNDILCLHIQILNNALVSHLFKHLFEPLYITPLLTPTKETCDEQVVSIFLLAQVYLTLHHEPLINRLTQILFETTDLPCKDAITDDSTASRFAFKDTNSTDEEKLLRSQSKVSLCPFNNKAYLSVLLSALQSSSGDHLTLVALCFFYALELSQGMQLVHQLTSQDSQSEGGYDGMLTEALLNILSQACQHDSKVRLVTLELAILLLKKVMERTGKEERKCKEEGSNTGASVMCCEDKKKGGEREKEEEVRIGENSLAGVREKEMGEEMRIEKEEEEEAFEYKEATEGAGIDDAGEVEGGSGTAVLSVHACVDESKKGCSEGSREGELERHEKEVACVEGIMTEATLLLRYYFKVWQKSEEIFLDMFEDEYRELTNSPLRVEHLTMEASVLLPPISTPLTGIHFCRRLPCGEVERARKAIRAFFLMRSLTFHMRNLSDSYLPLTKAHECVQPGDVLDLNNSDLIACTVIQPNKKERRFLVIDIMQLILVEPDSKKLGWGLVKFVAFLQDTEVAGDKEDSRCLQVSIHKASSRSPYRNTPSFSCSFLFDDHIRCMAARQRLAKGRLKARQRKMHMISKILSSTSHYSTSATSLDPHSSSSSSSFDRFSPSLPGRLHRKKHDTEEPCKASYKETKASSSKDQLPGFMLLAKGHDVERRSRKLKARLNTSSRPPLRTSQQPEEEEVPRSVEKKKKMFLTMAKEVKKQRSQRATSEEVELRARQTDSMSLSDKRFNALSLQPANQSEAVSSLSSQSSKDHLVESSQ